MNEEVKYPSFKSAQVTALVVASMAFFGGLLAGYIALEAHLQGANYTLTDQYGQFAISMRHGIVPTAIAAAVAAWIATYIAVKGVLRREHQKRLEWQSRLRSQHELEREVLQKLIAKASSDPVQEFLAARLEEVTR